MTWSTDLGASYDPLPESVQDPEDPLPENVQDPEDPLPEQVQDPEDPGACLAAALNSASATQPPQGAGHPLLPGASPGESARHLDYSGYVIVRLSNDLDLRLKDDDGKDLDESLGDAARRLALNGLRRLLRKYDLPQDSPRVVRTNIGQAASIDSPPREVSEDEPSKVNSVQSASRQLATLYDLEERARSSRFAPRHSLASYWRIDIGGQLDRSGGPDHEDLGHDRLVRKIVRELNELIGVDHAYRELAVSEPIVLAQDTYASIQEYLSQAPVGIDAAWAQEQVQDVNPSVKVTDLEQGWLPNHEDVPTSQLVFGSNRHDFGGYEGHHGTAVVAQIGAVADDTGVRGISGSYPHVQLVSHFNATEESSLNVAEAIVHAIPTMNRGDLLLLEVQRSFCPAECDRVDFDAIRLATASGVVVVEAAGNGNADLDQLEHLNRNSAAFRDSGAIMVGAARLDLPHNRFDGAIGVGSNYGSRIDCFGFGEGVVTAGYGDLNHPEGSSIATESAYTHQFGGTSAATPIVAGAALVIQNTREARTGTRLSPIEMRRLLSSPTSGTQQGPRVRGHIGVMPDLRAILRDTLGLTVDVYARDHLGDPGQVPIRNRAGTSPDIIVLPKSEVKAKSVQTLQKLFGRGSGKEDSHILGSRLRKGRDYSVFVRAMNKGAQDAHATRATVYWSPAATLVTPSMWHPLARRGKQKPIALPRGDSLMVSSPTHFTWAPGAEEHTDGFCCFTAILDDPSDKKPALPPGEAPYFNWNQFRNFLRQNNNLVWRNIHQIETPKSPDQPITVPFLLTGTPDRARVFDFSISQRLPSGMEVLLSVPASLAPQLRRDRFWKEDDYGDTVEFTLPKQPHLAVRRVRLVAAARHACKLSILLEKNFETPPGWSLDGHSVAIRQHHRGQEVGRITWLLGDSL